MLTYQQIVDHILIESGQFFDNLEATMLDEHKMEMMIIRELKYYSKYHPKILKFETALNYVTEFNLVKDPAVPDVITNIRYTGDTGTEIFYGAQLFGGTRRAIGESLSTFYWRYEKPRLIMRGIPGVYEITGIQKHYYDQIDKVIRTIDDSNYDFLNILVARFMISVGRSRRAFSIGEIPFSSDAESLISEGNQLMAEAKDRIETTSNYHLAIIP